MFLYVRGTAEGSNYHQDHKTNPGNAHSSLESLVPYVFLGCEVSCNMSLRVSLLGTVRDSFSSLLRVTTVSNHVKWRRDVTDEKMIAGNKCF